MKKHLHKGIALLCSAAIAAGMLVGCSSGSSSAAAPGSSSSASASVSNSESGPLFSEPVTLSMLTPSHASWPFQEDWYVVDLIKEYTNVDLKVTAVDTSGFSEKLNLTMASGELPDLMFLTDNTTVQQYAPQGAFINILDHLDKMPNFKAWYEENQQYAANYLSADGGLYQFPQQGVEETERRGWLYRADIFEELGLEMPTNKDEFYDVLVKLKEAYPDSYPLAFRSFAGTMAQMNMIAPSWGTYYLDITDNRYFGYDYDAQEWTFGPTSPEFKEMLEFYNKLYKEGLLLPNFLTIDTKGWQDVMANSDSFITIDYLSRIDFFNKAMRESNPEFTMAYMVPPAFNEDVGNQFAYSAKVLLGFVVSSQTKHLDEALAYLPLVTRNKDTARLIDVMYRQEYAASVNFAAFRGDLFPNSKVELDCLRERAPKQYANLHRIEAELREVLARLLTPEMAELFFESRSYPNRLYQRELERILEMPLA